MKKLYYPKMPNTRNCPGGRCVAFVKYDGTNLHFAWNRDFGWHAFGTRRDEFNLTEQGISEFQLAHPNLQECVDVFQSTLADGVEAIFHEHPHYPNFQDFTLFAEFLGPGSFAGLHKTVEPKELRMFDVWAEGFGFIGPKQFVTDFGSLPIATVVYEGKFTGKFADDVREGKYAVDEGVVCKGGLGGEDLWMAKIKTHAYLERLKIAFAERWEDYWE